MSDNPKDLGLESDEPSGVPFLRRCLLRLLEENATLAGEMREMRHERDEAKNERDSACAERDKFAAALLKIGYMGPTDDRGWLPGEVAREALGKEP